MTLKNFLIAIILGTALAAGIFVASTVNQPAELQKAFLIPQPDPLPEFSLLDQSGNSVGADVFKGQWNLVFFGFTNCPDVCPTTLQILSNVQRKLAELNKSAPRIVLVSVDPERDTPELLRRYLNYFGEDHLGLTGELGEIKKLTSALGIFFEKSSGEEENYGVDHSAAVILINPDGEFSGLFSAPHDIDAYTHDLPIVMSAN